MAISADWIAQNTATTGTGTITLGTAVAGFIRLQDDSRITDGALVNYTIEDGNDREMGIGTYASAGGTLDRTVVQRTLVSGTFDDTSPTAISLSGNAVVRCSAVADDRNFRGASVYNTAQQATSNQTSTYLSFDSELYDTTGFHDTVTNNDRFTIPAGVTKVRFCFVASFETNSTGVRVMYIKNSSNTTIYQAICAAFGTTVNTLTTGVVDVNAGDWFRATVYQTSGGALDVNAAITKFEIEVIE